MDVAYKLDCEWPLLARTDVARAFARWQECQPELRRFGTPRQLLLFLHSAPAEQTDAPLLALLELARQERLAGRTLVQVLLPALKVRADRIVHPARLRDEVWELLLFSAWEAICCYPVERRRVRVAANLVLQVVHRTTRDLRSPLLAHEDIDEHALSWLRPDAVATDEGTCRRAPAVSEPAAAKEPVSPEAVALAGVEAGVLSAEDADLILLTRVDGICLRVLARTLDVNYDTLRKRRQRAESALRNLLHSDPDVPKEAVSDPVSYAGAFLFRRRRRGAVASATDLHTVLAA
jgi:DNA-directed RNA polymerase specialized sigma24 family protein